MYGLSEISAIAIERRSRLRPRREGAMFDGSNQLLGEYQRELDAWTCVWYDAAVVRDFIRSPYHPDAATLKRLQVYFYARLKPLKHASRENTEKAPPCRIVIALQI